MVASLVALKTGPESMSSKIYCILATCVGRNPTSPCYFVRFAISPLNVELRNGIIVELEFQMFIARTGVLSKVNHHIFEFVPAAA